MKKIQPPNFRPRLATSNGSASGLPWPGADHASRFKQLVLPHLDSAYNLARYITRDPVLSEDIVQDAFVRAFRAFGQFRGESPKAWLFAIVRNCCRSAQAAAASTRLLAEVDEAGSEAQHDPTGTPEDAAIRNAEIGAVREAIEAIPEPFREAIVLRELEGFSYSEIAQITEVAMGTVMSRLSRAREMLAKLLLPSPGPEARMGNPERSAK